MKFALVVLVSIFASVLTYGVKQEDKYEPICATNGTTTVRFYNTNSLATVNDGLTAVDAKFVLTSSKNCKNLESNGCQLKCTTEYTPVCVSNINDAEKTIGNTCKMLAKNCKLHHPLAVINFGPCK